jgi:hypothetical protein
LSLVSSVLSDVMVYIKENEIEKAQQLLQERMEAYFVKEAQERRTKVTEINRSIVQIDIEIKKMEIQMQLLQKAVPTVILQSIDHYIVGLKKQRAELEVSKRRTLR